MKILSGWSSGSRHSKASPGFTMVGALVVFTLLGIVTLLMARGFNAFSKGTARLDRKVKGAALLATTASALVESDYAALTDLCNSKNAFAQINAGNCVQNNTLNRSLATTANLPLTTLEVLRDWDGNSTQTGFACVQLERCTRLAAGHLLEITLRGYWYDPGVADNLTTSILTFRRVPW